MMNAEVEYVSIEKAIPMQRVWSMPNHNTLSVQPIGQLVGGYIRKSKVSIDPFARDCDWATYTNDLNPQTKAKYHLDALDFLKELQQQQVVADLAIFDPPYSLRQCAEVYKSVGRPVTMRDTQIFGRWTEHKQVLASLLEVGGHVISCGWNTQGMGLKNGFLIVQILMVCHGGAHNDTIVTVERKVERETERQAGLF